MKRVNGTCYFWAGCHHRSHVGTNLRIEQALKVSRRHHADRIINQAMELTKSRPLHSSVSIIVVKTVVKTVDGLSSILLGWLPLAGQ